MLHLRRTAVALCVGGALAGCGAGHDPPTESLDEAPVVAIERLVAAVPRARVERSSAGSVARVYGTRLASGATPADAAEEFMRRHGAVLGLQPGDLEPGAAATPDAGGGPPVIPVKYDKRRRRFEFLLMKFSQQRNGVPVYGADVGMLVRNEPGHPLVHVSSRAKALGTFAPRLRGAAVDAVQARAAVRSPAARRLYEASAVAAARSPLTDFTEADPVIWAGDELAPAAPVLAATFIGELPARAGGQPQKWRFVVDAATGAVLHQESLIHFDTVSGQVSGEGTVGIVAPQCAGTAAVPLPDAQVRIVGGSSAFGDEDGHFTLESSSLDPVTVESTLVGRYFRVSDRVSSRDALLSMSVTPPATADFLHEAGDEFSLAQVNGYLNATQVREWLLDVHPEYPTIHSQLGFPVNVNLTGGYCPGNAWYDYSSINFCQASSGYANTSFAGVSHHEYGHHIVTSGGSGQGAYGEGMSDTIAMLIADDPGLGYGFFFNQCSAPLRSADNDCQYSATTCSTCGSAVHSCGQLLAGAVWSIRNQLAQSHPETYREILANLVVNSVLLHTGTSINHQIPIDFLTLDDDDGNLDNGTPHRAQICAGFEAHGLLCPPLAQGLAVEPGPNFVAQGDPGGPFQPASHTYSIENYGPGTIDYGVSVDVPWLTVPVPSGSLEEGASASVVVHLTAAANELPVGVYTGTVSFQNLTDHLGDATRTVTLRVGGPQLLYSWDMDVDPGWTAQGQWQYGVPLGQQGDPSSGHTGSHVYGYNLAGTYPPSLPETHLTTAAIDCSNLSEVQLKFRRWLCIEPSYWDHAYVRVSNDGVNWMTIWQNPTSTIVDQQWVEQEFDISAVAAGQSTVYVRWTMGATDSVVQYCGWNIDDVEIWGTQLPPTSCTTDAECDDGLYCNGAEACQAGVCVSGTPVACDDGVACTVDSCDEVSDACVHAPNDAVCDNGTFCDGAELCDPVSGCVAGAPVQCDDGIACTIDACDEGMQGCSHTPDHAVCDNGLFCDGEETCSTESGCISGPSPCQGACDEIEQTCEAGACATDGDCADGDYCNGAETCVAGSCQAGTPWGQACYDAVPLAKHQQSGSFETTGEKWFVVTDAIYGWQASEVAGRTIRVNGVVVTPGQMPLPAPIDGKRYFHFSAGDRPWASWSFW